MALCGCAVRRERAWAPWPHASLQRSWLRSVDGPDIEVVLERLHLLLAERHFHIAPGEVPASSGAPAGWADGIGRSCRDGSRHDRQCCNSRCVRFHAPLCKLRQRIKVTNNVDGYKGAQGRRPPRGLRPEDDLTKTTSNSSLKNSQQASMESRTTGSAS